MTKPFTILLRGPSGSGKSTWLQENVDPERDIVVSRDKIRMMLFNTESMENENLVTKVEHAMIESALRQSKNVWVDNTNIEQKYVTSIAEIAMQYGEVFTKSFDTSLEQCLYNNEYRATTGGRDVPEKVIRSQHKRMQKPITLPTYAEPYVADESKDKAFIFDIDGTLARMTGRSPYDYSRVNEDEAIESVSTISKLLYEKQYKIIVLSGRKYECSTQTINWLLANDIKCNHLYMRRDGDNRRDREVKLELFNHYIRNEYNVLGVFDDRKQIVRLYHSLGVHTFDVGQGSDF